MEIDAMILTSEFVVFAAVIGFIIVAIGIVIKAFGEEIGLGDTGNREDYDEDEEDEDEYSEEIKKDYEKWKQHRLVETEREKKEQNKVERRVTPIDVGEFE